MRSLLAGPGLASNYVVRLVCDADRGGSGVGVASRTRSYATDGGVLLGLSLIHI